MRKTNQPTNQTSCVHPCSPTTLLLLWHGTEGEAEILPRKSGREAQLKECASVLSGARPETKTGEKWAMKYHYLLITGQVICSKMFFPQNSYFKYYGWNLKYGKSGFSDFATVSVDNHPSPHITTVFSIKFCSFTCLFTRHCEQVE